MSLQLLKTTKYNMSEWHVDTSCAFFLLLFWWEGGGWAAVHHKITTLEYTVYCVEHCQGGAQMRGSLTKYFHSDFQCSAKA